MHLRGPHRRLPPGRRPGADPPGPDRARRRHRRRPRHRPGRARAAGDRRGRAGRRGRRPTAARTRPVRLRRPLRLVPAPGQRPGMSATIGYQELRAATVGQVAQLMAAAASTAPKSGGQLFLAGKPNFMETVIADDPGTRRDLAAWMRARGKERRERIWFRDAPMVQASAKAPPAMLAALWTVSNGRCYTPGCIMPVVLEVRPGVYQKKSQVAHIYGVVRTGAPRYRSDMPAGERDSFANLLLLCTAHHEEVDGKDGEDRYPPETLRRWKAQHEGAAGP